MRASRAGGKPVRWLTLAALAAGAGLMWVRASERLSLAAFPPGSERKLLGLSGGQLYVADLSGARGCLAVETFPVGGGRGRVVFRDTTPGRVTRSMDSRPNVTLHGDELLYALGGFQPERRATLVARRRAAPPVERAAPPRLFHARLPNGAAQALLPEVKARSLALGPEYCFWISDDTRSGGHGRRAPSYELRLTPLAGGRTRKIANLTDVVPLYPCADGVSWLTANAQGRMLFHADAEDLEIQVFPEFPSLMPPVELGDRFYWVQLDPREPIGPPVWLCSSRRDGSDQRRLIALGGTRSSRGFGSLFADNGRLYCRVMDAAQQAGVENESVLCRVWPERPDPLEEVARVSSHLDLPVFLDDTRCYYLSQVKRDNWLDWSPSGLQGEPWVLLKEASLTR